MSDKKDNLNNDCDSSNSEEKNKIWMISKKFLR